MRARARAGARSPSPHRRPQPSLQPSLQRLPQPRSRRPQPGLEPRPQPSNQPRSVGPQPLAWSLQPGLGATRGRCYMLGALLQPQVRRRVCTCWLYLLGAPSSKTLNSGSRSGTRVELVQAAPPLTTLQAAPSSRSPSKKVESAKAAAVKTATGIAAVEKGVKKVLRACRLFYLSNRAPHLK